MRVRWCVCCGACACACAYLDIATGSGAEGVEYVAGPRYAVEDDRCGQGHLEIARGESLAHVPLQGLLAVVQHHAAGRGRCLHAGDLPPVRSWPINRKNTCVSCCVSCCMGGAYRVPIGEGDVDFAVLEVVVDGVVELQLRQYLHLISCRINFLNKPTQ